MAANPRLYAQLEEISAIGYSVFFCQNGQGKAWDNETRIARSVNSNVDLRIFPGRIWV